MWIKAKGANVDALPERAVLAYIGESGALEYHPEWIFNLQKEGPVAKSNNRPGVQWSEDWGMYVKFCWECVDASDMWDCVIMRVELDDVVAFWPLETPENINMEIEKWAEEMKEE